MDLPQKKIEWRAFLPKLWCEITEYNNKSHFDLWSPAQVDALIFCKRCILSDRVSSKEYILDRDIKRSTRDFILGSTKSRVVHLISQSNVQG